jgi:hypothetical protein
MMAMALCCVLYAVASSRPNAPRLSTHSTRQSFTDLEITGVIAGAPANSRHFVTYNDLLTLHEIDETITDDENFKELNAPKVHISGVPLSALAKALGATPDATFITARCSDGYLGIFSPSYITAHNPVLILKINGLTSADWARQVHNEDPGPYLVTGKHFVPSYRVLAYEEQPQIPDNVLSIAFNTPQAIAAAIMPTVEFAPDSPQQQGMEIASVTCLKCHNSGSIGGTKANRPWSKLSNDAINDPVTFQKRILNPKSVSRDALMPANSTYDAKTLAALTAYFQSISKE